MVRNFYNQTVYVFGCNLDGSRRDEPILTSENTLNAFDSLWKIIGDDDSVNKYTPFHFLYYNEGEPSPFKSVVWNKKRILNELKLNKLDDESEYSTYFPEDGTFIELNKTTNKIRKLNELDIRRIIGRSVRPNLRLNRIINKGEKYFTGDFVISYQKD